MSSSSKLRPALLGALAHVLDHVVVRLARVESAWCMPSAISPAAMNDRGPFIAAHQQRHPLLHRPRGREQAGVLEEVALEVDLALVEERAHHVQRLLAGARAACFAAQSMSYCVHAARSCRSRRPPPCARSSARRASRAAATISVGSRRNTCVTFGPKRIRSRLVGGGGEQHRPVLVPRLVDRVDRVEAELVGGPDHLDRVRPADSPAACSS